MENSMERALFFPCPTAYEAAYRKSIVEYPVGPHAHDGAELYFTLTALPDVFLNNHVFSVQEGTLIIIPAFCVHQLYHETNVVYERYVLNLQDAWLKNVLFDPAMHSLPGLSQGSSPILLPLKSAQKKELAKEFRKLNEHSRLSTPLSLADLFTLLHHVTILTREYADKNPSIPVSPSQEKVNEIISFIQAHVYDDLSLQEIADHFFLHPDYLGRLFKQHAHISIGRYLTLQKITTAQELLRSGHTVTETAEALQFSSYAYFFKTFQKTAGISPSKYRALYAAKTTVSPSPARSISPSHDPIHAE